MRAHDHGDGTMTVTIEPGDVLAYGVVYRGAEQTFSRLAIVNARAIIGPGVVETAIELGGHFAGGDYSVGFYPDQASA